MKGVQYIKSDKKWRATLGSVNRYIGQYPTKQEAINARLLAEKEHNYSSRSEIKTKKGKHISQTRLKELTIYNPITGIFTRKIDRGVSHKAGTTFKGIDKDGYINMRLDGKLYRGHRLAFLYMTGSIPDLVDHKDFKRSNNIWTNIRASTKQLNNNHRDPTKSKYGVIGLGFNKSRNKWTAERTAKGKRFKLYYGDDKNEAIKILKQFELNHK